MRRFLILFEELPIDVVSVKSGQNGPEVVTACRCVNVGLFVSGNLRRNVEVSLAVGKPDNLGVVTFPGSALKRVSPDERSISFFLLKAMNVLRELPLGGKKKLDNGIVVQRTNVKDLLQGWEPSRIYVSFLDPSIQPKQVDVRPQGLFLYELTSTALTDLIKKIPENLLPRPPHPERFILDINMYCDQL
jgi:tRNA pseudouridine-54 N-methylase